VGGVRGELGSAAIVGARLPSRSREEEESRNKSRLGVPKLYNKENGRGGSKSWGAEYGEKGEKSKDAVLSGLLTFFVKRGEGQCKTGMERGQQWLRT